MESSDKTLIRSTDDEGTPSIIDVGSDSLNFLSSDITLTTFGLTEAKECGGVTRS